MRKSLLMVTAAVVFLSFILPLSSFSQEKTPIRVVLCHDLTGPYSSLEKEMDIGARFYMKYWKDNELVKGVDLIYDIYDSGTNIDKTRAALMDAFGKSPKPVLSFDGTSSTTGLGVKPLGERFRIPILAASSARGILFPPSWSFSAQPDYPSMLGGVGNWIKANWKPDSKVSWIRDHYEKRNPRLGVIAWDNAFGRSVVLDDSINYLKEIGIDFVGAEYVPYSPKDLTPNLKRLFEQKVDFIYFVTYEAVQNLALRDAQSLGKRDSFMDILFWFTDPRMLQRMTGVELLRNTIVFTGYAVLLEDCPDFIQKWFKEELKRGEMDPLLQATSGIVWFDIWREAIQRTVKKYGAKNVTGDACYDIITTDFKDYKPICYTSKITYGKYKTFGPNSANVYLFQKEKIVKVDSNVTIPDLSPVEWRGKK